jgi:hypothetical protein
MKRLLPFAPGLWVAEGNPVSFNGFAYGTRMAVIRLANNDLFLWSPIALDETLQSEVVSLGRPAHLVAPNKLHHLFLGAWKAAWPDALLWAPPGLAARRPDLHFDASLPDTPTPWAGEIDQVCFGGSFAMTEIVFFHRASRTALFADLIQNFPPDWFRGWRGFVARWGGIVAPNPSAPRDWRASFLNRSAARHALAQIKSWNAERVVIAHGEMARSDGAAFIAKAFRWLA